MWRTTLITLAATALLASVGCGKKAPQINDKEHLKVVVKADGAILADGVQCDLADLSSLDFHGIGIN